MEEKICGGGEAATGDLLVMRLAGSVWKRGRGGEGFQLAYLPPRLESSWTIVSV